jgi:hypothetical protein
MYYRYNDLHGNGLQVSHASSWHADCYPSRRGAKRVEEARTPQMDLKASCTVGGRPGALIVSSDGAQLFAFDQTRPEMSVVGVSGWRVIDRVDLSRPGASQPRVLGGFEDAVFLGGLPGAVRVFSAASRRELGSIPCSGDACDLGILAELRRAVVASASDSQGRIDLVGLPSQEPVGRLGLPLRPVPGSLALLPSQGLGAVVLADPATRDEVIALFECRPGSEACLLRVAGGVRSVVFEPSGRYLYAACHDESALLVIDVREEREVDRVLLAGEPYRVACDRDGRRIWALCEKLGHVAMIDPIDHTVLRRTQLAGLTAGVERIAFSPEGRLAVVPEIQGGCISLLECGAMGSPYGELDDCLELGREIGEIAWSPLGEEIYVSSPKSGAVLRLGVDRGTHDMKDTDLYLMDQLLRQEDPVGRKNPLFPP